MNSRLLLIGLVALASCQKEPSVVVTDNTVKAQTYLDVAYGNNAQQKIDVYLPAARTTTTTKVIILVHGGACDRSCSVATAPVEPNRIRECH